MRSGFATTFARFHQVGPAADSNITYIETGYIPPAPSSLAQEIKRVVRVFKGSLRQRVVLLNAESGRIQPDLLAAALLTLLPANRLPKLAMMGDMWQPNDGLRGRFDRLLIGLADRAIGRYILYSSEAVSGFPAIWGIDESKCRHALYFYSFDDAEMSLAKPAAVGEHIFAGGNAHRDYGPLVDAAREFPDEHFILATDRLDDHGDLPANVTAGPVTHDAFVDLMARSKMVVIPVRRDIARSNSQQTYLNAMMMGKPVIISDVWGVRDHAVDGESIVIVDGSADGYVQAIAGLLDGENENLIAAGRRAAERFSPQTHVASVVEVMVEYGREIEVVSN